MCPVSPWSIHVLRQSILLSLASCTCWVCITYTGMCSVMDTCVCGQVWNEEDADEEVLAMVARTGLRTTVGALLRQVLNPMHLTEYRKDPFVKVGFTCHDDDDDDNSNSHCTKRASGFLQPYLSQAHVSGEHHIPWLSISACRFSCHAATCSASFGMLHVVRNSSLYTAAVDHCVVLYSNTGKKEFDMTHNNVNRVHNGLTGSFTSLHHLPGTL